MYVPVAIPVAIPVAPAAVNRTGLLRLTIVTHTVHYTGSLHNAQHLESRRTARLTVSQPRTETGVVMPFSDLSRIAILTLNTVNDGN